MKQCNICGKTISEYSSECPYCHNINTAVDSENFQALYNNENGQCIFCSNSAMRFALFAPIAFIFVKLFVAILNFISSEMGANIITQYNFVVEFISSILITFAMLLVFYSPIKQTLKNNDKKIFLTAIIPVLLMYFPNIITDFINKYYYPRTQILILCKFIFIIISTILSYLLTRIFANFILQIELKKDATININKPTDNYKKPSWKKVIFIVVTIFIVLIASIVIFDAIMDATHKNTDELIEDKNKIQSQMNDTWEKIEENQRKIEEAERKLDEYYANH